MKKLFMNRLVLIYFIIIATLVIKAQAAPHMQQIQFTNDTDYYILVDLMDTQGNPFRKNPLSEPEKTLILPKAQSSKPTIISTGTPYRYFGKATLTISQGKNFKPDDPSTSSLTFELQDGLEETFPNGPKVRVAKTKIDQKESEQSALQYDYEVTIMPKQQ